MKNNAFVSLSSAILILLLGLMSCRPTIPTPKPMGYFRIDLPDGHQYRNFDSTSFPFSFRYPTYSEITRDSNLVKEEKEPYWINIYFPAMDATIFLSYKKANAQQPLDQLINESYKLSFSHDVKADYIHTPAIKTANGLQGVLYKVGGNAASNYQFYVTDGGTEFMRGALYFNNPPNIDSIKPALDFLKTDLDTLIQSFRFK